MKGEKENCNCYFLSVSLSLGFLRGLRINMKTFSSSRLTVVVVLNPPREVSSTIGLNKRLVIRVTFLLYLRENKDIYKGKMLGNKEMSRRFSAFFNSRLFIYAFIPNVFRLYSFRYKKARDFFARFLFFFNPRCENKQNTSFDFFLRCFSSAVPESSLLKHMKFLGYPDMFG